MTTAVELTVCGDVDRLCLEEGDIIVITLRDRLSRDAISQIRTQAQLMFKGHEVVVLADGLTLSVTKPVAEEAGEPKEARGQSVAR